MSASAFLFLPPTLPFPHFMNIGQILHQFSQLKVLVVGDLMLDRYLLGKVTRVSPEAPVPIVEWKAEENRLGGAANVGLNVASLGAEVFLCGVIGDDNGGQQFIELMNQHGLDTSLILQTPKRPTTVKTRIMAHDQQLLRLDKETAEYLSGEGAEILLKKVNGFLKGQSIDICILQDYNKGVLSRKIISSILQLTKEKDILTAVDPKTKNFWAYKGVHLFKPNLKEVQDALPFPIQPLEDGLKKGAALIKEKLQNQLLLITLSENGVFVSSEDQKGIYPTAKRQVADVCGAGDAVVAIASLAMAIGLPEKEIAELANLAGGQVVEKVGVVPVDREQLRKEVRHTA